MIEEASDIQQPMVDYSVCKGVLWKELLSNIQKHRVWGGTPVFKSKLCYLTQFAALRVSIFSCSISGFIFFN